ncbi:MAG: endonuclease III [Bacteroidota bacterium]
MSKETTNWAEVFKPLIQKYKNKKHPLDYQNLYQLLVMVVLSAQDSDANINKVAPPLFEAFPNMKSLAESSIEELIPYIIKVRNYNTKASWLIEIAQTLKTDKNIPTTLDELVALKGIGRKSANVIMREAEVPAEGIICDLHVIRVAPRIGIVPESKDGNKIEKELMKVLPKEIWGEIGMAISFLGRETCRPTNPKHSECVVSDHCEYCKLHNS